MKPVAYSKDALKTLRRVPPKVAATIQEKIEQYAKNPGELANNVKALKGEKGVLRIRVGNWRVLVTESAELLTVVRVAPRGSAYD